MSGSSARPAGQDMALAAAVIVVTVAGSWAISRHGGHQSGPHARQLSLPGYGLAVAAGAALAWRRLRPTAVLLVIFAAVLSYNQLGYPSGPAYLPLIIAFCTAISRGDRRVAYAVLAAGYAIAVLTGSLSGRGLPTLAEATGLAAWLLVLAAIGEIIRIRTRARRAETEEAAAAEQARSEQARRQAGEERLRIARDLHDVLAHQLALITVQANVGLAMLDKEPSRSGAALSAIKDAGNRALGELRTVLDVLRAADDGGRAAPEVAAIRNETTGSAAGCPASLRPAPLRPAPLISRDADLAAVIDGTRAAGLTVAQQTAGAVRRLPVPLDQAAYRIVQESLTNAVRHAGPGTGIALRVEYAEHALRVIIEDDGRGTPARSEPSAGGTAGSGTAGSGVAAIGRTGSGNGLPGMRERAAALDGTLTAGHRPGGGFRVLAELPLREET